MKKLTREWVKKAEADFRLADKLSQEKAPFHDQLCFHCQQSVEKYLKAILEERGEPIARTHILRDLIHLLLPLYASLSKYRRGASFLTRFAVATRYPGDTATKRQAQAALRWAIQLRQAARVILGIQKKSS